MDGDIIANHGIARVSHKVFKVKVLYMYWIGCYY